LSSGLATASTKYALAGFTAPDLLVVELGVATLSLWSLPTVRRRAGSCVRRGHVVLGALEPGVAYALFDFGLARTSAADGAVLVSLESVAVSIFAVVFLRERLRRGLVVGAAFGAAGALLLGAGEGHSGASIAGDALVVAGVVVAAAYTVIARRIVSIGDAVVETAYQMAGGLAVALVVWSAVSVSGGSMLDRPSGSQWLAAFATGVLGSAVPFLLFTFAVARLPAVRTGIVLNLIPVFGVAAAVLLLDERLAVTQLLGTLLVVGGLGAAQLATRDV
jgi:drug/metabolite transporter (DMT)-like permease